MFANSVSPPTGGVRMQRSSEPSDGTSVNDMSECHWRPVYLESEGEPSGFGSFVTIRSSGYCG